MYDWLYEWTMMVDGLKCAERIFNIVDLRRSRSYDRITIT